MHKNHSTNWGHSRYIYRISRLLLGVLCGALLFLYGCGPQYFFHAAQKLETKGFYVQAAQAYEKVYAAYPEDIRAPESLYHAARIYQKKLTLHSQAKLYYDKILKEYPRSMPWFRLAELGIFNSPDYFPLSDGSFWIEGDSKSGGSNMRAEWTCREVSTGTFRIERRMFAGKHFVTRVVRYFRKEKYELREFPREKEERHTKLLVYPFATGSSWKTIKDGKAVYYEIIANAETISVKAGVFHGCLKVSERYPDFPHSRKYDYYAPGVGWVLTTTASVGGSEHRNSELMSYKIMPEEENSRVFLQAKHQ